MNVFIWACLLYIITSPHAADTDSPAALLDFIMLEITGALLMQDMAMMPIPMPRAMSRERHGVVNKGRDSIQSPGDTFGEGSDDHAHWAMLLMRELLLIPSIFVGGLWGHTCGGPRVLPLRRACLR
jgi:hypothetical protein